MSDRYKRGFTLIEILVATSIFIIILTISTGALVVGYDALRKVRLFKNTMENTNIAVESVIKKIRVARSIQCGASPPLGVTADCDLGSGGDSSISFVSSVDDVQFVYRLSGTRIEFASCPGAGCVPTEDDFGALTSPDLEIRDLRFYVVGSSISDNIQPRVTVTLHGEANLPGKSDLDTNIYLQTTVTQSVLDI